MCMSVKVLSEVFDKSLTSGNARLVLLALADCASEDGACWPSLRKLKKKSGVSEETVRKYLHAFEAIGLISSEERYDVGGRRTSNVYTINLEMLGRDSPEHKTLYSVIPKSKRRGRGRYEPVQRGVGMNMFIGGRYEPVHRVYNEPSIEPL